MHIWVSPLASWVGFAYWNNKFSEGNKSSGSFMTEAYPEFFKGHFQLSVKMVCLNSSSYSWLLYLSISITFTVHTILDIVSFQLHFQSNTLSVPIYSAWACSAQHKIVCHFINSRMVVWWLFLLQAILQPVCPCISLCLSTISRGRLCPHPSFVQPNDFIQSVSPYTVYYNYQGTFHYHR